MKYLLLSFFLSLSPAFLPSRTFEGWFQGLKFQDVFGVVYARVGWLAS